MAKPYAPVNEVQSDIATGNTWTRGTDTSIVLTDASDFDSGGGYIRIGDTSSFALMEYTGKTSNTLTGLTACTLGVVVSSGDATKEWPAGTEVSRVCAAEDINDTRVESCFRVTQAQAQYIQDSTYVTLLFDNEDFDCGTEFDSSVVSGTATGTTTNKLVDSGAFTEAESYYLGRIVFNTTDNTYTTVTAKDDDNTLSISSNIMASGETYKLYHSRFTPTTPGYYLLTLNATLQGLNNDKKIIVQIRRNGTCIALGRTTSGGTTSDFCGQSASVVIYMDGVDDYITGVLWMNHGSAIPTAAEDTYYGFTQMSGHIVGRTG